MFLGRAVIRVFNIVLLISFSISVFHLFKSESGILRKFELTENVSEKTHMLKKINKDISEQEQKVSLLREDNLDLDILEEQSRRLFNTHKKGHIQIILD